MTVGGNPIPIPTHTDRTSPISPPTPHPRAGPVGNPSPLAVNFLEERFGPHPVCLKATPGSVMQEIHPGAAACLNPSISSLPRNPPLPLPSTNRFVWKGGQRIHTTHTHTTHATHHTCMHIAQMHIFITLYPRTHAACTHTMMCPHSTHAFTYATHACTTCVHICATHHLHTYWLWLERAG